MFVQNGEDEFLTVKKGKSEKIGEAGIYDLSIGGVIGAEESSRVKAQNSLREMLGLKLKSSEVKFIG